MSDELHRAVGNQEQDVANGKIAGYCLLCQTPYPCEYIRSPALIAENADLTAKLKLAVEAINLTRIGLEGEVHHSTDIKTSHHCREMLQRLDLFLAKIGEQR